MNPEHYEFISQKLFDNGALDVFKTSIMMKKERPGILITVVYKEEDEDIIDEVILRYTSTLGIRKRRENRKTLNRCFRTIDTEYGEINFKFSFLGSELIKYKAEYEDCKKAAIKFDLPIYKIINRANYLVEKMIENNQIILR